jgi:hypothetical protein
LAVTNRVIHIKDGILEGFHKLINIVHINTSSYPQKVIRLQKPNVALFIVLFHIINRVVDELFPQENPLT